MKKDELTKLTDLQLKEVPHIKERIRAIDAILEDNDLDIDSLEKIKCERDRLHLKLSKIIKAIGALDNQNQRIICYRYFDKLTYKVIACNVGFKDSITISRRIKKSLLQLGRILYGFEDEFWKEIYCVD